MKKRSQPPPPNALGTLAELQSLLGHTFANPDLLTLALTHRSFVYDAGLQSTEDLADPARDNEQLEFVGDAVLGLLAAESLTHRFPNSREGELTRLRASVVSRKHLGQVGTALDLGRWLRLGQTAENNGGRRNAALFSNAVEALIAALYLDAGLDPARRFVETHVLTPAMPALELSLSATNGLSGAVGDHKSALQEMLQAANLGRPEYRLISESGPDHRRIFRVQLEIDPAPTLPALQGILSEAEGPSKKQAQQEAARLAVTRIAAVLPASATPAPSAPESPRA